jgi:uncharacterized protein
MKSQWIDKKIDYDGSQLRSLFAYMEFGILGDSIVGFRGACDVTPENMIDGEDKRASAKICGSDMIHFIVELFDCELLAGVGVQRVLASLVKDALTQENPEYGPRLSREGDDIYFMSEFGEKKKFSISIASRSPVSTLVHFAFNVSNEGTPVPTCALNDFEIEPEDFIRTLLESARAEIASMREATRKVFPSK